MNKTLSKDDKKLIDKLTNLPVDFWDFRSMSTDDLTHGLHSYPAIMIYPISRNILRVVKEITPIKNILDPFSGSGTVLVEGIISGLEEVYGSDLNPLARLIGKVKTTLIKPNELLNAKEQLIIDINSKYGCYQNYINEINNYMKDELKFDLTSKDKWGSNAYTYLEKFCHDRNCDLAFPDFKNIGYWFKPNVILELQIIKNCINIVENINIKEFFLLIFSEVIRLVSNRRNNEFKMYRMEKTKVENFNPCVYNEFIKILNRNIGKQIDFYNICFKNNNRTTVKIYNNNAMTLEDIPDNSIDIVITSPPYGDSRTTVAYGEYSRLSLQWLNLFQEDDILNIDKKLMGGNKYKKGFEYLLSSETLKKSLKKIISIDMERAGDVFSFYKDLDKSLETIR